MGRWGQSGQLWAEWAAVGSGGQQALVETSALLVLATLAALPRQDHAVEKCTAPQSNTIVPRQIEKLLLQGARCHGLTGTEKFSS